jgi:hypothetical protein
LVQLAHISAMTHCIGRRRWVEVGERCLPGHGRRRRRRLSPRRRGFGDLRVSDEWPVRIEVCCGLGTWGASVEADVGPDSDIQ